MLLSCLNALAKIGMYNTWTDWKTVEWSGINWNTLGCSRASMLGCKHCRKDTFEQLVNSYSEHLQYIWAHDHGECSRHGSPQCMCYMNIHEHTWTALGSRPNSTCKASGNIKKCQLPRHQALANPHINYLAGQITSGSPLWRGWHVSVGNQTRASTVGGVHSRKEPFKQLVNSCLEHLNMSVPPRRILAPCAILCMVELTSKYLNVLKRNGCAGVAKIAR
jgi:hypothetical protein